ncbi:hypothetical protein TNCT_103671 [Trichonephila clavata]|uniref:Uncharacterized protein n=1 Tax=Trichonephila clavata TaxID=2740835 RepID=A0A8X6F192_TRICU|nr:hypothetical protein TNCT_103671 [Trichonephila clavata]
MEGNVKKSTFASMRSDPSPNWSDYTSANRCQEEVQPEVTYGQFGGGERCQPRHKSAPHLTPTDACHLKLTHANKCCPCRAR